MCRINVALYLFIINFIKISNIRLGYYNGNLRTYFGRFPFVIPFLPFLVVSKDGSGMSLLHPDDISTNIKKNIHKSIAHVLK